MPVDTERTRRAGRTSSRLIALFRPVRRAVALLLRVLGWALLTAATLVLLYVVYLVWFTSLTSTEGQRELGAAFGTDAGTTGAGLGDDPTPVDGTLAVGEAFASLRFERGGAPLLHDDVLYVVEGVGADQLRLGPGRYPGSADAGGGGNLAIAGHRTTYGAPFGALDELTTGDTIHVLDRAGTEWIYRYARQLVVAPDETWVLGDDPLGSGAPTLTLTTCHPRHSAAERLVVFAELVDHRVVD